MEEDVIAVVRSASNPREVLSQFMAFAEEQGGSLELSVKHAYSRIADPRDRLDEIIWQFKVHAPKGYTLDSVTHAPIKTNYSYIRQIHDH